MGRHYATPSFCAWRIGGLTLYTVSNLKFSKVKSPQHGFYKIQTLIVLNEKIQLFGNEPPFRALLLGEPPSRGLLYYLQDVA